MSHDDPPLSMVDLTVPVNLRNSCEIGPENLNHPVGGG
jgi:hypothetical protein